MDVHKNSAHVPEGTKGVPSLIELSPEDILRIVSTLSVDEVVSTMDRLREAGVY